jgi:hypothetical protein
MSSPQNSDTQLGTDRLTESGLNLIDSLLASSKWGGSVGRGVSLTYSFAWSSLSSAYWASNPSYSTVNEPSSATSLNASQQVAARATLTTWSNVANIKFTEVAETSTNVGDLRFAWTTKTQTGAASWAYAPSGYYADGGDIWLSQPALGADPTSDWLAGGYDYQILIHEIGHALGLKHPFEGSPLLPAGQDTRQYTVMSYTDHPNNVFLRATANANGSYSFNYIYVEPDTPMLYDVAAMQYLYGANQSYKTGNDTYTFDPATPFYRTLWDAGGTDTISVSNFTKGCIIDLQEGHFSSITIDTDPIPKNYSGGTQPTYHGTDNLAIAYGAVIENAIGGSGNDTLIGNPANNSLTGGSGNDALDGGAGIDMAIFSGPNINYRITATSAGFAVQDKAGVDGTDTLANIERLQFSNEKLALDLDGNAGSIAKILGVVVGPSSVANKNYVGVGLSYLDGGTGYQELMQMALTTVGATTHAAAVNLLWTNLFGSAPSADQAAPYVALLDNGTYSAGSMGAAAADSDLNKTNINLVGLHQTGIEYL